MIEFTQKQQELAKAILDDGCRFVLYGGAIRGGKSYGALALIILLALVYPKSRWAIVRKDLPTLRRNVLPTFDKLRQEASLSNFVPPANQSTWTSTLGNGSELLFFTESIDQDKDLNRWRGLEVNGFYLDEANELTEAAFEKAMERLGSWVVPGVPRPPSVILMTANPCRNWLKELVYDRHKAGDLKHPWRYIAATPMDNPHLPPDYRETLEQLRDKNPIAYARFVLGDWDVSDGTIFTRDKFVFHDKKDPSDDALGFFADIAYTRKKTSDFCAFGLAGVNPAGVKRWYYTKLERMDTEQSTAYLIARAAEFEEQELAVTFYVEANDAYIELLRQNAKQQGVKMIIEQLKPHGQSKADRILVTKAGLNLWEFDRGSQPLINQFLDWSPELEGKVPDDGPDMHAYADVTLKWSAHQTSGWQPKPPKDSMALKVWKAQKRKPIDERKPQTW